MIYIVDIIIDIFVPTVDKMHPNLSFWGKKLFSGKGPSPSTIPHSP